MQMQEGRSQSDRLGTRNNKMAQERVEGSGSAKHLSPAAPTGSKAAARHSHADRSAMGHLQGLDASIKPAGRLLQPTVSSRIKAKGAEGHQIAEKQLTLRQRQQQKAAASAAKPGPQTTKQRQQQQQQRGQMQAFSAKTKAETANKQQQQQPTGSIAASRPGPQEDHNSVATVRAPAAATAAAPAEYSAAGDLESASGFTNSGALSQTLKHNSIQAAKLRIGAAVGLHVAEGLLVDYSRHLQSTEASAAGSTSSTYLPTSAAPAGTALWPLQLLHHQQQAATADQLSNTLRPNPLFSASASSGEQELFGRCSVNGQYSTLLSPMRQPAAAAGGCSDTLSAAAGGGYSRYSPWAHGSSSSSTGSAASSTPGVGSGTALGSSTALRIEEFSNTMSNPVFRGRAVLDWMLRHSNCGSLNSTGGSFAGGFAAVEAAAAVAPPTGSAAAAAAAAASGVQDGTVTSGSSSLLLQGLQPADTVHRAALGASGTAATTASSTHSTASNSASKSDGAGPGSSLASNLAHSLASTGFSTDSEALGQFVEEQVATDNFTITTETAPNTTHFQGKHMKAAAAAAAARAAAARARAAGADAAAVAAAAEAAAAAAEAAAAAAAASAATPATICEDDDEYEIEVSEDGQVVEFSTATEAAIEAVLEQRQEQQQWCRDLGARPGMSTERLPGDIIYEMLPGVGDAAIWATLPQQQLSNTLRHQPNSHSSNGNYHSSAFASTLSGCNSSATAEAAAAAAGSGGSFSDASRSTRSFWYGTGGVFAGLAGGTFGFMGTVGSLASSAGDSLRSTADLGAGVPAEGGDSPGPDDAMLLEEMTKAQLLLRENGLTDLYLARTASTMLGAQALVLSAMQAAKPDAGNSDGQQGPQLGAQQQQAEKKCVQPAAAHSADKRSKLKRAISSRMQRQVWQPDPDKPALKIVWNPFGTLLCLFYLAATVYYFYVRFAFTMALGKTSWYSVSICACEIVGCTAVIPYCLMLLRRCHYCGTGSGLPADDGHFKLPPEKRFKVRVLIPCYKEPLSTIQATVGAAITAELPPGCTRVIYLCDDGKDPAKEAYIRRLGPDAVYVSGRVRAPGEINGKSGNLNNCLRNVIYADMLPADSSALNINKTISTEEALCITTTAPAAPAAPGATAVAGKADSCAPADKPARDGIPTQELVVVFDADMCAKPNFFRHVLEVMWEDDVALCLTPQAFSNIHPTADIWNNINLQFFQYVLPGCDALGYTACTGTNFCVRAQALAKVGWFPTYTITEDYALSMELKKAGCRGRYLPLNLVEGEAPDEIGAVLQQRSRWAKGHMQVFFSKRCPLFQSDLPLLQRILYTNGTWAYFCTILSTFVYTCVPMVSLVWGVHPVALNGPFALAATLYFLAGGLVNFSVHKVGHMQGMFLSLVSNYLLAFTYLKAIINTWLSLIGLKRKAGFKATDKKGVTASAGAALRAAVAAVSEFSVTVSQSLASTYRSFADTMRSSHAGGSTLSAPNRSSLDSTSAFGGNHTARGLTLTSRWHAWRGPSAAGATINQHGLQTINEAAVGFNDVNIPSGFVSSGYDSGYESHAAAKSVSDFVWSPNTSASGQHDEATPTAAAEVLGSTASTATTSSSSSSASQVSTRLHDASRLSTSTAASSASAAKVQRPSAAAAPLRPSSAQQPRSGAGLPLGEGLESTTPEEAQAAPRPLPAARVQINATGLARVVLPAAPAAGGRAIATAGAAPGSAVSASGSSSPAADGGDAQPAAGSKTQPAQAAASTATSQEPSSAASSPSILLKPSKTVPAAGSDPAKPTITTSITASDDHNSSGSHSCCSCSWLRTNLQSVGWKLDPWVILLSLAVSCAALAAGVVQLAVRARTPDQKSAIQQVLSGGTIDEFAILAMLLAGINTIPPLLFFVYMFTKGRVLHAAVWVGQMLNGALFIGAVVALWLLIPPSHDLTAALQLSSSFLQAQRATQPEALPSYSGLFPVGSALNLKDTAITAEALESYPWLASVTGSSADIVQGGFYMGGDYVKHSFPLATNMAMLAWSLLRFGTAYQQAGVLSELRGSLLVGAQYLIDCHIAPGQFVAQIGQPADYAVSIASASGSRSLPASMPPNRTALVVNASQPGARGAEVLAAASAALAATSAVLKADKALFDSSAMVRTLHDTALSEAASLYREAHAMLPQPNQPFTQLDTLIAEGGSVSDLVGVQVFGSSSVMDDMAHAAVWLAVATGNQSLLLESNAYLSEHWAKEAQWDSPSYYWPSHDNMAWPAAILLLGQLQQQQADIQMSTSIAAMQPHHNALSHMFVGWMAGQNKLADIISLTPSGFPWAANGKPMPTATAAAMLGMLWSAEDAAAESVAAAAGLSGVRRLSDPVRDRMHCWGLQMTQYVLGSGRSTTFSYLIGYGKSSPTRPQHRLASCTKDGACGVAAGLMAQAANPVQLKGALVAGPAQDGTYADDRTVSSQSSVGLHHNVPLIGLLGGLLSVGVTPGQCAAGHGLFQLYTVRNLP